MPAIQYKVVDAFSHLPLHGNPVAVFNLFNTPPASIPSDATLAKIANWLNLSETTFILPATDSNVANYRLRIFTPTTELPFAGHPTLGSAYAAIEFGIVNPATLATPNRIVQECGVGLIEIDLTFAADSHRPTKLMLTMPEPAITQLTDLETTELAQALGVQRQHIVSKPAVVNVGIQWTIVQLDSVDRLVNLTPDMTGIVATNRMVTSFANYTREEGSGINADADIEVRSFAPTDNINEDPVCGSGNGSVAIYKQALGDGFADTEGGKRSYVANQGQCVGRKGIISLGFNESNGRVTVGGACVTTLNGTIEV